MWAMQLTSPQRFTRVEVPDPNPGDGQMLVRLSCASICASDIPKFRGITTPQLRNPGYPIHECIGYVTISKADGFVSGDRVLTMPVNDCGLAQNVLADIRATHKVSCHELTDQVATLIQPVATVLHAVDRLSLRPGIRVVIFGLGPIGLIFSHVLSGQSAEVRGVDLVDRTSFAADFRLAETQCCSSQEWLPADPPEIVIEAVGHQQQTLIDALHAVKHQGTVLVFGVPDDTYYALPIQTIFDKNLALISASQPPWRRYFTLAEDYVSQHYDVFARLVTHQMPISQVEDAFQSCSRPAPERLKVVLNVEEA
jgi:L-iditol 2-dehydrogenase